MRGSTPSCRACIDKQSENSHFDKYVAANFINCYTQRATGYFIEYQWSTHPKTITFLKIFKITG